MVVLHFHQGVPITPATPPTLDLFDPALVLWALHRGASSKVDMTHQWNFWPLMPLTLAEARARCCPNCRPRRSCWARLRDDRPRTLGNGAFHVSAVTRNAIDH
jgi:hypothetical protein